MKHLKPYYKLFEGINNPIEDYVSYFTDEHDFEVNLPSIGVCKLTLNDSNYNSIEILKNYESSIKSIKSDFTIDHHYITLHDSGVIIYISREIKGVAEEGKEWVCNSKEQEIAYNAVSKCLEKGEWLSPEADMDQRSISFTKKEGYSGVVSWIRIDSNGYLRMPILRGEKRSSRTELPFNDEDIKWFKKIIELDDYIELEEFDILHEKTQKELREIYK